MLLCDSFQPSRGMKNGTYKSWSSIWRCVKHHDNRPTSWSRQMGSCLFHSSSRGHLEIGPLRPERREGGGAGGGGGSPLR